MRSRIITNFALHFSVELVLNQNLILEKNGRFYIINKTLKQLLHEDFFYIGIFLGKVKDGKFFPSFNLLTMLAKKNANRIIINHKAAWLFICGRPVLSKSVLRVFGSCKKNRHVLVLNEFNECLGFGKIVRNLDAKDESNEISISNVSDIGDFLRRER